MVVERAFVISLPFRKDRLSSFRSFTAGFKSIPEIELWPAIHGDTCLPPETWVAGAGAWGCYRSHLGLLEYCLNNSVTSYIVFEDDAQFRPDFDDKFESFVSKVPDDWQQVYLGGQLLHCDTHPTVKICEGVYRPYNVNRTHCYIVSRGGMLPIYQHLSDLPFVAREHIDHHLGRWHEDQRNAVYCPGRWLVGQMGSSSNVSGKIEEVQFFQDPIHSALEHRLYDDPICVIFRGSRRLLHESRDYLHQGNSLDAMGCDITLSLAAKYADPTPEIDRWYGWIRGEIVRSNSQALPCLFHPRITDEMIADCKFRPIVIEPKTLDDVTEAYEEIKAGTIQA